MLTSHRDGMVHDKDVNFIRIIAVVCVFKSHIKQCNNLYVSRENFTSNEL